MVKNLAANTGDLGSIPGLGRSHGEGNGNPLKYSCLGNPMDRGTWWATVHRGRTESDMIERLTLSFNVCRVKYQVHSILFILGLDIS